MEREYDIRRIPKKSMVGIKKTAVLISFLGVYKACGNRAYFPDYPAGSVLCVKFYVPCGSIEAFQKIHCINEGF